ncbi:uncharacterized protein LOC129603595 [Betta splendens]|uniref:Uncharacterized protein LOC129603595 n=1 Tax=Betta splendens TaxID=158456 RepID=A0A9W2XJ25_BETSP|nr:uncharacterized protein LOC129603595 [Betta splendens]
MLGRRLTASCFISQRYGGHRMLAREATEEPLQIKFNNCTTMEEYLTQTWLIRPCCDHRVSTELKPTERRASAGSSAERAKVLAGCLIPLQSRAGQVRSCPCRTKLGPPRLGARALGRVSGAGWPRRDKSSLCRNSIAAGLQQRTFYSLWLGNAKGNPLPHPGTSPAAEVHRARSSQPARHKHRRRAVYRKQTASLLCLASIKGNSAEDFLEGVMRLTHKRISQLHSHSFKRKYICPPSVSTSPSTRRNRTGEAKRPNCKTRLRPHNQTPVHVSVCPCTRMTAAAVFLFIPTEKSRSATDVERPRPTHKADQQPACLANQQDRN